MRKRYAIAIIAFILAISGVFSQENQKNQKYKYYLEERINKTIGSEKWNLLKQYLIKKRIFIIPPEKTIHLKANGKMLTPFSKDLKSKSNLKQIGVWKIDAKKQLFIVNSKSLNLIQRYKSFFISNYDDKNTLTNVIFFTGKKYKKPSDLDEFISNYFQLTVEQVRKK